MRATTAKKINRATDIMGKRQSKSKRRKLRKQYTALNKFERAEMLKDLE